MEIKPRIEAKGEFLKYPEDVQSGEHGSHMMFTPIRYLEKSGSDPENMSSTEVRLRPIVLYHPNNLEVAYSHQWADESLGLVGGEYANRGLTTHMIGTIGKGMLENARNAAAGAAGLEAAAFDYRRKAIKNPKLAAIFKGTAFREFNFNFSMAPKSETEVRSVINIIESFKYNSASATNIGAAILQFPNSWEIKTYSGTAGAGMNLFYMHKCVNTGVKCNYSPNSIWSTFKNGFPVTVDLEVGFKEITVLTQSDFRFSDKNIKDGVNMNDPTRGM